MKNHLLPIVLLILSGVTIVDANAYSNGSTEPLTGYQELKNREFDKISINGPADLKNVKIISGSIAGDVDFEDITIKKTLDITGHLFGSNGEFHKLHVIGSVRLTQSNMEYLEVTGPTTLKNCSVTRRANIIGFLKATNSVLENVDAKVNSMILHDSKAGTIIIRKSGALEQKLTLNNSSAKNVTFESGNGKIVVIGNAEITGNIKGAIMVQE